MQQTEHSTTVNDMHELRAAAGRLYTELGDVTITIAGRSALLSYVLKMSDETLTTIPYPAMMVPVFTPPYETRTRGLGNREPYGWMSEVARR